MCGDSFELVRVTRAPVVDPRRISDATAKALAIHNWLGAEFAEARLSGTDSRQVGGCHRSYRPVSGTGLPCARQVDAQTKGVRSTTSSTAVREAEDLVLTNRAVHDGERSLGRARPR
jgi:hypothetical protein